MSELTSLPRGRAVVFASGAPATLVATVPWMEGEQADAVRASIAAHDPAAPAPVDHALAGAAASTLAWLNASTAIKQDEAKDA